MYEIKFSGIFHWVYLLMRMPLKTRKVSNELLDHLDAEDPEAIRSRKDLHKINLFYGEYALDKEAD